jgi:hypothetical protein
MSASALPIHGDEEPFFGYNWLDEATVDVSYFTAFVPRAKKPVYQLSGNKAPRSQTEFLFAYWSVFHFRFVASLINCNGSFQQ